MRKKETREHSKTENVMGRESYRDWDGQVEISTKT